MFYWLIRICNSYSWKERHLYKLQLYVNRYIQKIALIWFCSGFFLKNKLDINVLYERRIVCDNCTSSSICRLKHLCSFNFLHILWIHLSFTPIKNIMNEHELNVRIEQPIYSQGQNPVNSSIPRRGSYTVFLWTHQMIRPFFIHAI